MYVSVRLDGTGKKSVQHSFRYQFIGVFGVGEFNRGKIKFQKSIFWAGAAPGGGQNTPLTKSSTEASYEAFFIQITYPV